MTTMRNIPAIAVLAGALCASISWAAERPSPPRGWEAGSEWRFTIVDKGREPQSVTFRVEPLPARSCLGGTWKKLKLVKGAYKNLSEPAWSLRGQELTVLLASDICDAYDQVRGQVRDGRFSGPHSNFGLEGTEDIGYASAVRVR